MLQEGSGSSSPFLGVEKRESLGRGQPQGRRLSSRPRLSPGPPGILRVHRWSAQPSREAWGQGAGNRVLFFLTLFSAHHPGTRRAARQPQWLRALTLELTLACLVQIPDATASQLFCKLGLIIAPLPHMAVARIKCINILKCLDTHLAQSTC